MLPNFIQKTWSIRLPYMVLAREEALLECTNSWIYWGLRRYPWNRHRKPLWEK